MKGRNMGNWLAFCVVGMFWASSTAVSAQSCSAASSQPVVGVHLPKVFGAAQTVGFSSLNRHPALLPIVFSPIAANQPGNGFRPASPASKAPFLWKADDLPFFCRIEYHLGKKAQIPFKFRLGSVEYVDWLEGKPGNAGYLPN